MNSFSNAYRSQCEHNFFDRLEVDVPELYRQHPLDTVRRLHEWLTPRGLLIFDYILSDAKGLDTTQGRNQRCDVLAFIGEHFDVLEGALDLEASMGITVPGNVYHE